MSPIDIIYLPLQPNPNIELLRTPNVNLGIFPTVRRYRFCRRPKSNYRKEQETPKRSFLTLYYTWVGSAAVSGGEGRRSAAWSTRPGR